jgi:3-oxoadipate enol-lactonase
MHELIHQLRQEKAILKKSRSSGKYRWCRLTFSRIERRQVAEPATQIWRATPMPMIDADGCPIHVTIDGREGGPTIILSNSLGTTYRMWDPQLAALGEHFRVVRYDRRGHGRSGTQGPYSFERFGRDVLAVLDALNIRTAHWCGLSMGGMVGQWLGANAGDRFDRIVIANTTHHFADPSRFHDRIKAVTQGGMASIADAVIASWLTEDFREREPAITDDIRRMVIATPVAGYVGCCEALSRLDHRELLPKIDRPVLIIAGRHDMGTTVQMAEAMRKAIPKASLTLLDAAHLSNVEQAYAFNDALIGFLTQK